MAITLTPFFPNPSEWTYDGLKKIESYSSTSYRMYTATVKQPTISYHTEGEIRGSQGDAGPRDVAAKLFLVEQDGVAVSPPVAVFDQTNREPYRVVNISAVWPEIGDFVYLYSLVGTNSHDGYGGESYIYLRPLQDNTPPLLTLRNKTGFNGPPTILEIDLYDEISSSVKASIEVDGVLGSDVTTFPYNLSIPSGGYHTVKVIGYDEFDNASGALTYKFNASNWTGDLLQTFKTFEITSSAGNVGNAVSYVNFYIDSSPLISNTVSEILKTTIYDNLTDSGLTWDVPSGGVSYSRTPVGGSSSDTIYIDAIDLIDDYDTLKFLKGVQNRNKNMNMFIGVADPTSVLTVEEKCVLPNPNVLTFNVLSPAQDSSGIYNFYNPIAIEYRVETTITPDTPFNFDSKFYRISFDYSSDTIIKQIDTSVIEQIIFTPDPNDTIATIEFFNSCGEIEIRTLNIKHSDINSTVNPTDPITGTTIGSGSTPIGQLYVVGTTPNYHNLIITK